MANNEKHYDSHKWCSKCGKWRPKRHKFCPECGNTLRWTNGRAKCRHTQPHRFVDVPSTWHLPSRWEATA